MEQLVVDMEALRERSFAVVDARTVADTIVAGFASVHSFFHQNTPTEKKAIILHFIFSTLFEIILSVFWILFSLSFFFVFLFLFFFVFCLVFFWFFVLT